MSKENLLTEADPQEVSQAEQEAAQSAGVYVHTFQLPFSYGGRTYDRLTFRFDQLTGADSLAVEDELQLLGKAVILPAYSGQYLTRISARACQEGIDFMAFKAMPIKDYHQIRSRARAFFLASES